MPASPESVSGYFATRRVRVDRGGNPATYDWTRWFQLQVRHTSTTCTENSSAVAASRAISSLLRAEPDTCPSLSPKTHDTKVTCSFRQIGHSVDDGRPWNLAARSRYGLASQTSDTAVRPA